ncbi:serine/threonine protein kinase [Actinomadura sp. HBU206391]|uniref:serine/threonine protein kinase n=1 Tax=Actinomadura sp. HBU206391 TaxID=2731692 RepID=UPI00164FA6EF|nr:serine/threonine protein kinase [Actinomadura sp. HBU206391]MBC6457047.1 protein kinase [Actinomadura sp. HBU206391]
MEPLRHDDPRQVGPYRLEGRLGGGGMGQVYLGRSPGVRRVAVKIVRPDLADDAGFRRRFASEITAARRVGGFYTAQVVDADPDAGPPWLVTAYVPGPSLHQAVEAHGPLPAAAVGVLGAGLAEGLAAIHACDLVHRDLKPSNVILAEDGPRVIDFGIARALDATSHTLSRAVIGTPAFMSPEQARGRPVGPASDVFSLGSVLVFAGTGRGAFGTGHPDAVIYRVVHDEPDLSGLTGHLTGLVAACLEKNPDDRPTVTDLLDVLAAPTGDSTGWLPPNITSMITERHAATRAPTGGPSFEVSIDEVDAEVPAPASETPRDTTVADGEQNWPQGVGTVQARAGETVAGYTPVAVPWLPGETAGARKATVVRWHKQVGDTVTVGEPLLEVSSVRGGIVITSPTSGILYMAYRRVGESTRTGSVIAGVGTPEATVPSAPLPRPARIIILSLLSLLIVSLVMGVVSVASPLFTDDIHKAQVGDCVAQEYPVRDNKLDVQNVKWFKMPCALMKVRSSFGAENDPDGYYKVLYRDPSGECSRYVKNWSDTDHRQTNWGEMSLCMRKL